MARPATGSNSPAALVLAPGIEPWRHQPGETREAFERFLQFLDVDPLVRTKKRMTVVHDLLVTRDPHMCSVSALQNMATLNHWHLRAAAYDDHKRQQAEIAAERAEQEWAEAIARRRAEIRLKHLDAAAEVIQKGLHALAVKAPEAINATDAIRMIDVGVKIEKETLGITAKANAAADEPDHVNDLSDDQTAARLRQLADELARRINNQNSAAAAPDVVDAEVIPPDRDSSDDQQAPGEDSRGPTGEQREPGSGDGSGDGFDEWLAERLAIEPPRPE
jgi:hypothetical protein